MIKIWTRKQVDQLVNQNKNIVEGKIPEEVITVVEDTIQILDEAYGEIRDPERDLGGFLCIFDKGSINECDEYQQSLNKYGLSDEMAEFTEPITTSNDCLGITNYQWYQQVYILSSDFGICIIYKEDKR